MDLSPSQRRTRLGAALSAAALVLAGCGGGIFIGIGDDNDEPPSVSLVVDVDMASPGQTVRLAAAASDDFCLDDVAFYRLAPDGSARLLGNDGARPFEWDAVIPDEGRPQVQFFARAHDCHGQASDSALVTVQVR